jgi:hypothetical protein
MSHTSQKAAKAVKRLRSVWQQRVRTSDAAQLLSYQSSRMHTGQGRLATARLIALP